MIWTPQQERALRDVRRWLADPSRQVYRLFGFAGTGKTTLAREIAENVDGTVLFCAYTGKAALVLQQRGCPGASTIHSLIYRGRERGRAKLASLELRLSDRLRELHETRGDDPLFNSERAETDPEVIEVKRLIREEQAARPVVFSLNTESEVRHAALVVVDECSMVDEQIGKDLLSFGTKVLVLGDPAQLPPIGGGGFFTENVKPDTMLTDIQRQARDNPIITMATMIREGSLPPLGRYGTSVVTDQVDPEAALAADQILVGRNSTRFATNRRVRSLLGIPGWGPKAGDRLVCLRNNHEMGLLNGALWRAATDGDLYEDKITLTVENDDGLQLEVLCHAQHFRGESDSLAWWMRREAEEFDFGYALTVHKSQGSQWPNVALFDESAAFRGDRWRWLYTGVTRAAERLTLVRS